MTTWLVKAARTPFGRLDSEVRTQMWVLRSMAEES